MPIVQMEKLRLIGSLISLRPLSMSSGILELGSSLTQTFHHSCLHLPRYTHTQTHTHTHTIRDSSSLTGVTTVPSFGSFPWD